MSEEDFSRYTIHVSTSESDHLVGSSLSQDAIAIVVVVDVE